MMISDSGLLFWDTLYIVCLCIVDEGTNHFVLVSGV